MSDERYTFEQTKVRLGEILTSVRRKDTSLEQSLELLEEGVRLANVCNELIDQRAWGSSDDGELADGPQEVDGDAESETGATVFAEAAEDDERD